MTCKAVITTIEEITGNGSYTSGGFRPGIPDKRSTSPPCSVSGNFTFVEVHNVRIVQYSLTHEDYALFPGGGNFSDTTMTLEDSACPFSNATRCRVFVEIDRTWKYYGIAPSDPLPTTNVDVQGFVYWNPTAVGAAWHSYTGWEIHPITATRPTGEFFPTTLGTFFWTTLILAVAFAGLLILFLYRRASHGRKMTVSLTMPGAIAPTVEGVTDDGQLLQFLERNSGGKPVESQIEIGTHHNWNKHLTLSLAILSAAFGIMLLWEYVNNVYAQDWVRQNLAEASLLLILVILAVVLVPVGIILTHRFLRKKKP